MAPGTSQGIGTPWVNFTPQRSPLRPRALPRPPSPPQVQCRQGRRQTAGRGKRRPSLEGRPPTHRGRKRWQDLEAARWEGDQGGRPGREGDRGEKGGSSSPSTSSDTRRLRPLNRAPTRPRQATPEPGREPSCRPACMCLPDAGTCQGPREPGVSRCTRFASPSEARCSLDTTRDALVPETRTSR